MAPLKTEHPTQQQSPAADSTSASGFSRSQTSSASNGARSHPRVRDDLALTFDDVLLAPRHSTTHPREVSIASRFTRGITLKNWEQ